MNAITEQIDLLNQGFAQIGLDYDPEFRALWVRMAPAGRPCFSRPFLKEVRECQLAIEASGGRLVRNGKWHGFDYVVLASKLDRAFNLGGDLTLFRKLVERQDREGLMDYAQQCVDISYANHLNYNLPVTTISLVQGKALGGGFESALSSSVLIAERSAQFGLPEITFNIFPGMGAYSYLGRKIGMKASEELILSGRLYTGAELHEMGVVDVLAEDGRGEVALYEYLKRCSNSRNGIRGVLRARQQFNPVAYEELLNIARIWVDTSLNISERDLKMMERLVRAQERWVAIEARDPAMAHAAAA